MKAKKKSAGERRGPYDYWRFDGSELTREFGGSVEYGIWLHGMPGLALRTRNREAKEFFGMWFTEIDD